MVYPGMHSQLVTAELPVGDTAYVDGHAIQLDTLICAVEGWYVFTPQLVQAAVPVVPLCLPTSHAAHVPPFAP